MSHLGSFSSRPEFDFWEFVACVKCHLPFSTESGAPPQVPFWVTECGHIVCNNHLNADQHCVECAAPNIQVAPLQRKMDSPMSDWFRSATQTLESLAFAARFQIETLASQVRHYKKKCHQQRALLERAKQESQQFKLLRRKYDELKSRTQHSREYRDHHRLDTEPSTTRNGNGKRPMDAAHCSSPRSAATPVGPDRLTLQQPPPTPRLRRSEGERSLTPLERPGTSRFATHFAYGPPQPVHQVSGPSVLPPNPEVLHTIPGERRAIARKSPLSQAMDRQRANQQHFTHLGFDGHPPATTRSQLDMPPPPVPQTSKLLPVSTLSSSLNLSRGVDSHNTPVRPLQRANTGQPTLSSDRLPTAQRPPSQLRSQRFVAAPPLPGRMATSHSEFVRHFDSHHPPSTTPTRDSLRQRVPFPPPLG